MMGNIKMIGKMDLELFIGVMEKYIKDIGKMEKNMEKEKNNGLMVHISKESFLMG